MLAYRAKSAISIATYKGTRGSSMPQVKITEQITGRNGNMMVSISCWYALMNLVVWLTSVPPKRFEWNDML